MPRQDAAAIAFIALGTRAGWRDRLYELVAHPQGGPHADWGLRRDAFRQGGCAGECLAALHHAPSSYRPCVRARSRSSAAVQPARPWPSCRACAQSASPSASRGDPQRQPTLGVEVSFAWIVGGVVGGTSGLGAGATYGRDFDRTLVAASAGAFGGNRHEAAWRWRRWCRVSGRLRPCGRDRGKARTPFHFARIVLHHGRQRDARTRDDARRCPFDGHARRRVRHPHRVTRSPPPGSVETRCGGHERRT